MTLGRLFGDLLLALLVLSLAAAVLISLAWIVIPVVTAAGASRRGRRRCPASTGIEPLASAYPEADLAELDEALEAILAQERPRESARRR